MKVQHVSEFELSREEIEQIIFERFKHVTYIKREIVFVRDNSCDGKTLHKAKITFIVQQDETDSLPS